MTEQTEAPNLAQIGINAQYVKDFSFESPNSPQIFAPTASQPVLNMGVNMKTQPLGENVHEVVLMLKLEATLDEKAAFIAELAYAGVFTFPAMTEENLKYMLLAESPRYLFPFARSILSNAVRDAGFPQILINPIDFAALYQANAGSVSANKTPA